MSLPANTAQRISDPLLKIYQLTKKNDFVPLLTAIEPNLDNDWYLAFDAVGYPADFVNVIFDASPTFKAGMLVAVPNAESKYPPS